MHVSQSLLIREKIKKCHTWSDLKFIWRTILYHTVAENEW